MSLYIRLSVGSCEHCGTKENLQDSHIITRAKYPVRWIRANHQCLCYRCHLHWFHKGSDPVEVAYWIIEKIGIDTYVKLKIVSEYGPVPDTEDIKKIISELENKIQCLEKKTRKQKSKK